MAPLKINKQFQKAEQSGARFAIVFGEEYPELTVKILESRTEETIRSNTPVVEAVLKMLDGDDGPIIA
jgi:histidyl-tRNA synthetase